MGTIDDNARTYRIDSDRLRLSVGGYHLERFVRCRLRFAAVEDTAIRG
jgi:hypothetical protein